MANWKQRKRDQEAAGARTARYPHWWRQQGMEPVEQLARLYGQVRERLEQCERRLNAHIAASAKRKQKGV